MNIWFRILAVILLAGAIFGFGYRQGWFAGDASARAQLEPKVLALAAEKQEAQRQAAAMREASRLQADKLAEQLAARDAQITTLRRSLDDEIRARASAVRRALDGQLVRLLNQLTPIRGPVGPDGKTGAATPGDAADRRLAAAAADPDRPASATTPDDGSGASEQAVALALSERGTLYERCRARFTTLVAWVRENTD